MDENVEPVEMQMYRSAIRQLISQKSPRIISNDSSTCAAILTEELIRCSGSIVRIYSEALDDAVWGVPHVQSAIVGAIRRGIDFHVISGNGITDENRTHKLFSANNVKIRVSYRGKVPDFIVIDESAFWLETKIGLHKGVACAFSPVNVQQLIAVFNTLSSPNGTDGGLK